MPSLHLQRVVVSSSNYECPLVQHALQCLVRTQGHLMHVIRLHTKVPRTVGMTPSPGRNRSAPNATPMSLPFRKNRIWRNDHPAHGNENNLFLVNVHSTSDHIARAPCFAIGLRLSGMPLYASETVIRPAMHVITATLAPATTTLRDARTTSANFGGSG